MSLEGSPTYEALSLLPNGRDDPARSSVERSHGCRHTQGLTWRAELSDARGQARPLVPTDVPCPSPSFNSPPLRDPDFSFSARFNRVRPMTKPCFILSILLAASISIAEEEAWRGMVGNYCLECHDADVQKGDLNLETLLDAEVAAHTDEWEKVVRQTEARQMPPVGKDRPDEKSYEKLVSSLTGILDEIATAHPNPGRTDTLRRLTRTEYKNAVRDLLALEINASKLLPRDESSHGFDNVTVGDLSPALLERFLGAAQKVARLAVGTPLSEPESETYRLAPDFTQEDHVEGLPLGTRGGTLIKHHFPQTGEYELQVHLTRDRNGHVEGLNGRHDLVFLLGNKKQDTLKISPPKNRRDHNTVDANLKTRIQIPAGPQEIGVTFLKLASSVETSLRQPYEAHFNYHRHPRHSPAIYQVTITGPFDTESPGETPSREPIFISEDAEKIVANLLRKAWRRPVTDKDIERIMPFFRQEDDFEAGIEAALAAILVSREFLFRTESEPEGLAPGTPYSIGDLELASRLSFFLWSSLPDEPLLAAAEKGELSNPDILESHVLRMLADPRSDSLVTNFANQWLYLRNLDAITPDGRLFPGFDDNLRQAFKRETELLFESVLREDRSVLDLIQSEETFLNERLAKHYGIPHIYGPRFRKVALDPDSERGGILRHGSILTVTSYATRTSPVIRGNWILENVLGTPPPPPPPDVPALEDASVSADLPIRERLAAHRENAACASCHDVMDPIGFALENYDAVGRWRILDEGNPVDSAGGLPDGSEFDGVDGLENGLLQRPDLFVRTLTEKLLTYALGRGVEPSDAPAIRKIVSASQEDDYAFSAVISELVKSPPFRMRTAAPASERAH